MVKKYLFWLHNIWSKITRNILGRSAAPLTTLGLNNLKTVENEILIYKFKMLRIRPWFRIYIYHMYFLKKIKDSLISVTWFWHPIKSPLGHFEFGSQARFILNTLGYHNKMIISFLHENDQLCTISLHYNLNVLIKLFL